MIALALFATLLFMNPSLSSAHHGTSEPYYDARYYECRDGDQWIIEVYHFHINGQKYIGYHEIKASSGFCAIGTSQGEK